MKLRRRSYCYRMVSALYDEHVRQSAELRLVKTQTPEATVREMLRTSSLATCMELMLRFVCMIVSLYAYHSPFMQVS